jgi:integrase
MGLTVKKKCRERCDLSKRRKKCAHAKVIESYYVEFHVVDDGDVLKLVSGGGGQLKRWKVGSLNKTVAKQHEAVIKTRLLTGQFPSPTKVKAQSLTFRQWAEQYLELEQVKKLKSYRMRTDYVRNLINYFNNKPLGAITPEDVRRYRAQRVGPKGRPLAVQTINHDHTTLVHMLNVARSPQFGLIQDNSAAHVPKPNPQNDRDRIASCDEWTRLLGAAAPHLQRILIVLYTLGPRRGELLRLEWPDVDMHRREFTLRNTKNGETRTVPMTPDVYRVFTQLWQERRLDTQHVFLYKDKPIRDVKTAFDRACRRAGIKNLRLHDLRHTASTNLRRAGVDATTAMKIVGHKSERMHRRYNTVEPEDLRRAVSQLASYQANTLITPGSVASGAEHVSAYVSSRRP